MAQVVFVTDNRGFKRLFDDQGLIGKFENTNLDLTRVDDGTLRRTGKGQWIMVLDDSTEEGKNKIERAKKIRHYGKKYKIVDKEPITRAVDNLKTLAQPDRPTAPKGVEVTDDEKEEKIRKQYATKMREYGLLFSEVCKAGGSFLKTADPQKVERFKQLQSELGIEEEVATG